MEYAVHGCLKVCSSLDAAWCWQICNQSQHPQLLSTEYRSKQDSPEESDMHNCISWVHFKCQSCEASHLCMHLITHSQTLKSPVPQVSESNQCLLVSHEEHQILYQSFDGTHQGIGNLITSSSCVIPLKLWLTNV